MRSRLGALTASAFLALSLAACGGDDEADAFRVGWVYVGPIGDGGWTFAHDRGRLQVATAVEGVETFYIESVSDVPADDPTAAIRTFLTSNELDMLFTTSWGYMDPTHTLAAEFPDKTFEHCSGYQQSANETNYMGRIEQAVYLNGIVAAKMTRSKKLGYVAATPIPEVVRGINAFTLGARSIDPEITVEVKWVNNWFDVETEKARAAELIQGGCDVLDHDQDGNGTILKAAELSTTENPIYSFGYNTDAVSLDPDTVLTSAVFDWGPYYVRRVRAAVEGTWTNETFWGGMGDGVVKLGAWGNGLASVVEQRAVEAVRDEIVAGTLNIFAGPIHKQDGTIWIPEGEAMSDAEQLSSIEFVEGVIGSTTP